MIFWSELKLFSRTWWKNYIIAYTKLVCFGLWVDENCISGVWNGHMFARPTVWNLARYFITSALHVQFLLNYDHVHCVYSGRLQHINKNYADCIMR